METGCFKAQETPQRLAIPDAEIYYAVALDLTPPPGELLRELIETVPWRTQRIKLWGRTHWQPRLIAWYGEAGARYAYSGVEWQPVLWTTALDAIRAQAERLAGARFNGALLNYYRDERDSMGMHSDDEPELGPRPIIASVSLGEPRTLIFKHRLQRALLVKVLLGSGSLLLMKGDTQRFWKHGINKERRPLGPRVNITFRQIRPVHR